MTKKQELAVKNEQELAMFEDWAFEFDVSDTIMPRGKLMQATSDLVKDGEANIGEWIETIEGTLLAAKDKTLEVVLCHFSKRWVKYDATGNYVEQEPYTPANANRPWTEEDGSKNQLTYDFYCLLPQDIEGVPVVISMASTSAKVGKRWVTMLAKLNRLKLPIASYVFELGREKVSNDKHSWLNPTVKPGRESTQDERGTAYGWYKQITSGAARAHEEETEGDIV